LSNSTRELMWFEITETLIALLEVNVLCIYDNFRQTFLPYFSHGDKTPCKGKGERSIAVRNMPLRCGNSHSVTCHPAEVTFPPLPQPKLVRDLATPEGCKAELT